MTLYGRTAPIPRRTAWLAAPGRSYRYSGIREIGTGIPQFMIPLLERVRASVGVAFDSVLATHYRDGADRLGWHADDEAELGPEPALAIVSLGAPRMLRFRRRRGRVAGTGSLGVTLTAGSLLYMAPGVQRDWEHCVPARAQAGRRISLGLRRLHTADVTESTAAEAGAGNA